MDLDIYLNNIQKSESIFPIDSFPEKKEDKKKEILRTTYPNNKKEIKIDDKIDNLIGGI